MNINLAINEGSKILKSKFIPNPLLDAEILIAKTINKDRSYILLNSSDYINKNDLDNFEPYNPSTSFEVKIYSWIQTIYL